MARPSGDHAAPVFSPGCCDTRRARPPPAETIQRSGLLRGVRGERDLGAARRIRRQQVVGAHLRQHRHPAAVHVDRADLALAAACQRERDARAEHAALARERLHDVVGEVVDGVANVGGAVALGQRRLVAARDDVDPAFELSARRLHLDDGLRADLRPQRRRERQPFALQLRRERRWVEDLEQAGDVHVLRHRLDGGGAGVALGARHRELQHLHAARIDLEDLRGRQILFGGRAAHAGGQRQDRHDRQRETAARPRRIIGMRTTS